MRKLIFNSDQSSYPILIGTALHIELPLYLKNLGVSAETKILIITDDNVGSLYLQKLVKALNDFSTCYFIVPAGENSKSLDSVEKIIQFSLENGLDRTSLIIAFGGGMVGDLAGFAASIYMRGVAFIQLPTTILAHDSSIGGKVGINHRLGKNLIGAFYHPRLVLYDTSFLNSLSAREIRSGFAEIIKHSLIADKPFAKWLSSNYQGLLRLEQELLIEAVYKGIFIKANIVEQDENEKGIRAFLNYGHTLAHSIEIISEFKYTHGEAVAIGMVFACKIARKLGLAEEDTVNFTLDLIRKFQLPTAIPKTYDSDQLLNIMMKDKKFINGKIRMVLPVEIGKVEIFDKINRNLIIETIEELKYVNSGGINEPNN